MSIQSLPFVGSHFAPKLRILLTKVTADHSIALRRDCYVSFAKMVVIGICFGETHDIDNIR